MDMVSVMSKKKGVLLIPIFIICGIVLFIWIMIIIDTIYNSPDTSPISYQVEMKLDNRTENNDYVVLIYNLNSTKECPIEDARFSLYSPERRNMTNGMHRLSEIIDKSIDNETFIVFLDNDGDEKISVGDVFIIKSVAHIDDDGSPSPGYAGSGFSFEVMSEGNLIGFIDLN